MRCCRRKRTQRQQQQQQQQRQQPLISHHTLVQIEEEKGCSSLVDESEKIQKNSEAKKVQIRLIKV